MPSITPRPPKREEYRGGESKKEGADVEEGKRRGSKGGGENKKGE